MKLCKVNKYKRIKKAIITTEIIVLAAIGFAAISKNKSTINNNVLASQNSITYEQDDNNNISENTIDISSITSSIAKAKPTITPTKKPSPTVTKVPTKKPTVTSTPTPTPVPKAILYPTPGPDYNPKKQKDKLVALTFDDGPNAKYTLKILDILEKYNCTATFFVIGTEAKVYPDIVEEVYDSGMEIGSHSYSHENFKNYTKTQGLNDLKKVSKILKNITEENPVLFRPPGGNYNDLVRSYVPYPIFYWAKDSNDWNSKYTDKQVISNIMNDLNEGDVILCHDRVERTYNMLEKIIKSIQEKGYKIVSVSQMYDYYDIELENGQVYKGVKVKKNKH